MHILQSDFSLVIGRHKSNIPAIVDPLLHIIVLDCHICKLTDVSELKIYRQKNYLHKFRTEEGPYLGRLLEATASQMRNSVRITYRNGERCFQLVFFY